MSISQQAGTLAAPAPHTPTQLFAAGTWREAADGTTFADVSPSSGHHVLTGGAPAAVVTREEMDERG